MLNIYDPTVQNVVGYLSGNTVISYKTFLQSYRILYKEKQKEVRRLKKEMRKLKKENRILDALSRYYKKAPSKTRRFLIDKFLFEHNISNHPVDNKTIESYKKRIEYTNRKYIFGFNFGEINLKQLKDDPFIQCHNCHRWLPQNDMTTDREGESYCNNCRSECLACCEECNEYFRIDCRPCHHLNDGGYICDSCYDDGDYFTCERCGNVFRADDMNQLEDDDRCYCSSCFERTHRFILDHSVRAHDLPQVKLFQLSKDEWDCGNLYFGIELEVEANESRTNFAKHIIDIMGKDFVFCKHDGSLGEGGVEIVTAPASFKQQLFRWEAFWEGASSRRDDCLSYDTNRCGMHVHVSRKGLSLQEICKIVMFYNHPDNNNFIDFIARRTNNSYSKKVVKPYPVLLQEGGVDRDRYTAVNLTNKETIEIRIFRGTTYKEGFYKNLEFVKATIDFVKEEPLEELTYKKFLTFIAQDKKKDYYPNLINWIKKRKELKTNEEMPNTVFKLDDIKTKPLDVEDADNVVNL